MATTFGKTHLLDPEGNEPYLNELDIDSKEVYDKLAIIRVKNEDRFFIDERCKITYVVKTRKKYGLRIFWLSHKQYPPIRTEDCKPGFEFEIKTDNTLGHSTLPPSCHRDDPNFHYQLIGKDTIALQDCLNEGLRKMLSDCLRIKKKDDGERNINNGGAMNLNNKESRLTDRDIEEIIYHIKDYYQKGSRQNIILGLSGLLYKNRISLESAEKIVVGLCHATNDEEKNSRIAALYNTYNKGQMGEEISGASLISEVLARFTDPDTADDVLRKTKRLLTTYGNSVVAQLQDHIRQEFQQHVCEVLCYTPPIFVVAHSDKKQILYAKIEYKKLIGEEGPQQGLIGTEGKNGGE